MAPSAVDPTVSALAALPVREEKTYPAARIFPMKENRFEKPTPEQPDGREKALAQPAGSAAIVIDNGAYTYKLDSVSWRVTGTNTRRFLQARRL